MSEKLDAVTTSVRRVLVLNSLEFTAERNQEFVFQSVLKTNSATLGHFRNSKVRTALNNIINRTTGKYFSVAFI